MFPTLITIGPIHISSMFVGLVCAWIVFSFLFWRQLRSQAVREEYIYHMMFFGTIAAAVGGRIGFILTHWELFAGSLWIRMFTPWIQPGISFYGGFLAAGAVMLVLSRQFLIARSWFLDAFTVGFSSAFTWVALAVFLEGAIVGKPTTLPFGIPMPGYEGNRHPVLLYQMFSVFFILVVLFLIRQIRKTTMKRTGLYALWFFLLFSIAMFSIEFLVESHVYFTGLTYNQWVCIGIFAEAAGALITWGGGKELFRRYIPVAYKYVRNCIGGMYAKISRRTIA